MWIFNLTLGRICEFCHSQFESISFNIFIQILDYFHGQRLEATIVVAMGSFEIIFSCDCEIAFFCS